MSEGAAAKKAAFLGALVVSFKEKIHTDLLVHPGADHHHHHHHALPIPTHKALLVTNSYTCIIQSLLFLNIHSFIIYSQSSRSKVFRNMLDSDECKASAEDSITLPDLNYDELNSLLEFLYSGNLLAPYNQYRALYLAADKYDIPYLQDVCRDHFIASLTSRNVLDVLELASIPSDTILKSAAINHVVKHMEEVVVPMKYETFVQRNPSLGVEITRAYLRETKALAKDNNRSTASIRPHSRMY